VIGPSHLPGTRPPLNSILTIFKDNLDYRFETLTQRFFVKWHFVTRGVTIYFLDERAHREMTFHFEEVLPLSSAISQKIETLCKTKLHPVMYVDKQVENIGIEAAIQYTDSLQRIGLFFCQYNQHH